MGAAGSDAAIEAADVALLSEDLTRVPLAIRVSRHDMQTSRQNIVLSIAVLAAMIPSARAGWIGIITAVLVHEAAELLAVLNGLRGGQVRGETALYPARAML
jgi:cation transport ATPase